MHEMTLKVGDKAPDFKIKNQHDEMIDTQDFRGKNILLSFHPLAWTGVCDIQMRTLELKHHDFNELNTVALGVSVDSVPCKKAWADALGITKTHLVADFWPHGEVAKTYEQYIEKVGISGRSNILINEEGMIEFIRVYDIPQVPDIEEIITHLRNK